MKKVPDKTNNPMAFSSSSYEICVGGRISRQGAVWFEDMTLSVNTDTTPPQTIILSGLIDQATLYGLINRIRDLGLTLISVKRLDQINEI